MDTKKRQELKIELRARGFHWDYLDNWQHRVDMYWHTEVLSLDGSVSSPVGTLVPNQPGHPDHAARKSRIGLLPWAPSKDCKCKFCRERDWGQFFVNSEGLVEKKAEADHEILCDDCGFVPRGDTDSIKKFALRSHVKKHREKVPV